MTGDPEVITVVDYKAGNLTSVRLAFEHLGASVHVTDVPAHIGQASRIVFPGVGAAGAAMDSLQALGLIEPIRERVAAGVPFLGICIGMQLLFEYSQEDGGAHCLGILPGQVQRFQPESTTCKIPHMGWNTVEFLTPHPLLDGIEDRSEFYFVHSYYPDPSDAKLVAGRTPYADVNFASMVARQNLAATQFHPERSGRIGLRLLENFCRWDGRC